MSKPAASGHAQGTACDFAALISGSGDMNAVTDLDGRFLYCSGASTALFGWEPDKLVGRYQEELAHPDDAATLQGARSNQALWATVTTTYRFHCRDTSYRWVEVASRRVTTNGPQVVVHAVRDITQRQRQAAALELRACTDPLTGVANRTVLMDRLHQGLRRLGRNQGVLAVLYLDLDRFKVINDSLGHQVGDDLLLKIAERLSRHLRSADTLARLGGDEFVLVAEAVDDEEAAVTLANRIIEDGRRPFRVGSDEFSCTMSIGVACTADCRRSAEELLCEADLALYRAKDKGRDQVAVFDEALRTRAVDRMVTERLVRHAMDEGRIVVEYQPVVDLTDGFPIGAEALVRIYDPQRGLLPPTSFLGVAEETGLLLTIDEMVLADAVSHAAEWRLELGPRFSAVGINVTARHLADSRFRQAIVDQLTTHGVPPGDLKIEVTEQLLMEASNSAIAGLRELQAFGVSVGLDDFGTGYSSLAYLRQFPLDFLKIDKLFIDDLATNLTDRAVVAAIVTLAHALGLVVVAEGVELEVQRDILLDLNCDRAQGFLFAASGPPRAVSSLAEGWAGASTG